MKPAQKNKEYVKLVIVLVVLFLILGGFLLYVSTPLVSTKSVVLATEPVDPFDPVRGQYIIIRYEIGNIPIVDGIDVGETVYVSLVEDENKTARYKSASLNRPGKESLFIRGKVTSVSGGNMGVEYGIEQYFFERGAQFSTRGMEVEVKLSGNGGARITQLLQEGEPVEIIYENKTLTT